MLPALVMIITNLFVDKELTVLRLHRKTSSASCSFSIATFCFDVFETHSAAIFSFQISSSFVTRYNFCDGFSCKLLLYEFIRIFSFFNDKSAVEDKATGLRATLVGCPGLLIQ
jgi:hypothetical protein